MLYLRAGDEKGKAGQCGQDHIYERHRSPDTKTKGGKEVRKEDKSQLQDLLTHGIHQPSAVQTSHRQTSWSDLSQCCTAVPAADHTQLRPLTSGETHHFFLPMRHFFFAKTIYFMGTQTSRAVEVT